jgi:alpha-L-arabinofuranosidase
MGHPEPFDLRYVAIGNEDCGKKNYRGYICYDVFFFKICYCVIYTMDGILEIMK